MKARAWLLLFGTVAACSGTAVHAAKYSKPKTHIKIAAQPDKSAFTTDCRRPDPQIAQKLCYLRTDFDPKDLFHNGDPKRGTCKAASPNQKARVQRALDLAPEYVRKRLFCMKGIFLTTGGGFGSWGLWEAPDSQKGNPDRKPNDGKGNNRLFVAISEDAVKDDAKLDSLQVGNLANLLHVPGQLTQVAHFESADDPAWATLAYLAHELGHILVGLSNADGSDPNHPRRNANVGSGAPIDTCFETVFLDGSPPIPPDGSWDKNLFHTPLNMNRFFKFGDQGTNKQKNISFILSDLTGDAAKANAALLALYQSGEFVSGMAAVSPVEHMVVTFEFKVLADAVPLSGMSKPMIRPPASQAMLLNDFLTMTRPKQRQVDCLARLGMLTAP